MGYSPWDLDELDTTKVTWHIRTGLGNSGVAHPSHDVLDQKGCSAILLRLEVTLPDLGKNR